MDDDHADGSDGDGHSDGELLCRETIDERGKTDALLEIADFKRKRTRACCDPTKVDEYVRSMVQTETTLGFGPHQRFVTNENLVKLHRPQALSWIAKTRGSFGLRFQTAYLSMMCFDRYLSRRAIPDNDDASMAFKILAVACVSVSVKMEEESTLQLGEYEWEGYHLETGRIMTMEVEVLVALDWNLCLISPFAFLPYFVVKLFQNPPPKGVLLRIYGLISSLMGEVNLMAHRPSAIAAAATMVARGSSLTRHALEGRMNPIVCPDFPDIEHVFRCYELMLRLGMADLREPNRLNTPQIRPNTGRPVSTSDGFRGTSTTFKRTRLEFGRPDQDKGQPDPQIWPNTGRPVSTSDGFWGTSTTFKRTRLEFGRPDQDKGQPDQ